MPIYDYICSVCGQRTEVVHGIHGHGPLACPQCGAEGSMKKAFVPPAIHFKGSGWAKKDRAATSSPGRSASPKSDAGGASTTGSDSTAGSSTSRPPETTAGASPAGAAAD